MCFDTNIIIHEHKLLPGEKVLIAFKIWEGALYCAVILIDKADYKMSLNAVKPLLK